MRDTSAVGFCLGLGVARRVLPRDGLGSATAVIIAVLHDIGTMVVSAQDAPSDRPDVQACGAIDALNIRRREVSGGIHRGLRGNYRSERRSEGDNGGGRAAC